MKTLLAFSFFSSALAITTTVITGGTCTIDSHHPDNGGYHIIGVNGYKAVTANDDPDDITTYGDWGQKADDFLWTSNQSLTTYPVAESTLCAKGLRPMRRRAGRGYDPPCTDETEANNFRQIQTCSIMRFGFPASSGSTVFLMPNNDTFQACDFSIATQLTDGGTLPSGDSFIDYVFEDNSLDRAFYFASQNGCEEGQKIAVKVVDLYATEYEQAKKDGARSDRIRHCDCDHAIMTTPMSTEAAHAGFVDGCKSEMPEDLSCCPGDGDIGVEMVRGRYGTSAQYTGGGNCMRKSDQPWMVETARELYKFCSIAENKATCDKYKSGDCPYWRVYIGGGQGGSYAYNGEVDGTPGCSCTPDSDGNPPPYCAKNLEFGTDGGYSPKTDCSKCKDPGCFGTYNQQTAGVNMTSSSGDVNCWPGYLRYNGLNQRMPDIPENHACDGDASSYNVKCDWWYMYTNCKDLEEANWNATKLTAPDAAIRPHFETEITEAECTVGGGRTTTGALWVAAMKIYLASPEYLEDFPPPTDAPTAVPTPPPTAKPTAAPATPAPTPTEAPVSEESNCRLEAMAALSVWLISGLQ